MERKLVKHGPSTFMVSLPKRWIDRHNFKKGDSIKYEERPDSITFFAHDAPSDAKSIEVDLTGLDRSFLTFYVRALYRQGFHEITVRFANPVVMHHRTGEKMRVSSIIATEVQNLIGVEISSHSSNTIVLKQLAEPRLDELKPNVRRIFFLLNGTFEELAQALRDHDKVGVAAVEEKHDAITKFVNYTVRVLHILYQKEGKPYLMHAVMQLENITDLLKAFAREVEARAAPLDEPAYKIVEKLYEMHRLSENLFFQWDPEKANRVDVLREELYQMLWSNKNKDVTAVLHSLMPAVELYRDLIVARLCMPDDIFN